MDKIGSRGVIVNVSRLPANIGEMLNRFMSGDVVSLHIVGVTKDEKVISVSTNGIPDLIRKHDSF